MVRHQILRTRIIAPVAGAMLSGAFTAVPVHADYDPVLRPIIQTVRGDRTKGCPNSGLLSYDRKLEAVAQDYARSENLAKLPSTLPGYNRLLPVLGSGDPQAQAINSAYRRGAGPIIGTCSEFVYGVGFVRHDDRSVDVVTIVFGELTPPRHPSSIHLKPGYGAFYISGSGFSQNSTVTVIYNYHVNNTNTGADPLKFPVDSSGNFASIVKVSTMTDHGSLDVDAEDTGGLSTTKSIQY